jgi:hypothetical protein
MNKYGVALAADSAATFGKGQKVYHAAEKIFAIAQSPPVGLMISGSAEIMDMPWEIVIKTYVQQMAGRSFERLEQYAQDFLRFVEEARTLFPAALQEAWFRESVRRYWKEAFLEPLAAKLGGQRKTTSRRTADTLVRLMAREIDTLRQLPTLELGDVYGDRVLSEYAAVLDKLEHELLGPFALPEGFAAQFRAAIRLMHMQSWFHEADQSDVVIAGMGEVEPFPMLQAYQIGTIAAGKLRFAKTGEARVSRTVSAVVAPFGITEMVDIFYRGIDPGLELKFYDILRRRLSGRHAGAAPKITAPQARKIVEDVRKDVTDEIIERYQSPLIAAVDALPRPGLATMAEALVSLTALKVRMSVELADTVGGAIDVAILSRGEGFVWIKRRNAAPEAMTAPPIAAP